MLYIQCVLKIFRYWYLPIGLTLFAYWWSYCYQKWNSFFTKCSLTAINWECFQNFKKRKKRQNAEDLATLTTTLTIFWCTILTHIWSESNFFDTCRNKRFSSPILILVVSQSYHSPHPMFTSKLFQSSSCFCPAFIPIFILFLFGIHLNLYPSSISVCIPIIILLRHATVTVHRWTGETGGRWDQWPVEPVDKWGRWV